MQEILQNRIHEKIPEEYQNSVAGINGVLQLTKEIGEKPIDDKTKLQTFALFNQGYMFKINLTANDMVVTYATTYFQGKIDHLNTMEKEIVEEMINKRRGGRETNR